MGEVPAETVKTIAEGIKLRGLQDWIIMIMPDTLDYPRTNEAY